MMKKVLTLMLLCATIGFFSCNENEDPQETSIAVSEVTLNKKTLTLVDGYNKETLIATVMPENATNKDLKWTSSDKYVASISQTGEVTALSVGTTKIIAFSKADESKFAECEVVITKKTGLGIDAVSINKLILSLVVGTKETLIATVTPNDAEDKSVTWKSNNAAVATVSETGEVTGVTAGTTQIYANSVVDPTRRGQCNVTITSTAVDVTDIIIQKTLLLSVGQKKVMSANVLPDIATNKNLTWSSSDTAIATVSQTGEVIGVAAGIVKIQITSVSTPGKQTECTVTIVSDGFVDPYPTTVVSAFVNDEFEGGEDNMPFASSRWGFYSSDSNWPADAHLGWHIRTKNTDGSMYPEKYLVCGPANSTSSDVAAYAIMTPVNAMAADCKFFVFRIAWESDPADNSKLEVIASSDFAGNVKSATWKVVKTYTAKNGNNNTWQKEYIVLSDNILSKKLYLAFRYTGKKTSFRLKDVDFNGTHTHNND